MDTNRLMNPNVLNDTNHLIDWINYNLEFSEGDIVFVGKKTSSPDNNLYPNYLQFCKEYGIKPLSFNIFSTALLQQLNVLMKPGIEKLRNKQGTYLSNIRLNPNPTELKEVTIQNTENFLEEFSGFVNKSDKRPQLLLPKSL